MRKVFVKVLVCFCCLALIAVLGLGRASKLGDSQGISGANIGGPICFTMGGPDDGDDEITP